MRFSQFVIPLPAAAAGCCKVHPGDKAWPSASTWKSFNASVGGNLIVPVPPAAACHAGQPGYNASKCPALAKEWTTYQFHADDPVSVMIDQYANDTCLPDAKDPCSAAGYPAYVVNASTTDHVKRGVDFAREHNIRLIVKSTGHDYLGRSVAPGALSLWVRHLNGVQFHDGSFTLHGGKKLPGSAVTVGGGTEMYDIYSATAKHNQTVVGGGAKSVSVGGYITGGGHSSLSSRYGLAADSVLEITVVTPMGELVTANEDCNTDLFWAMRGGGGSTFGVITSLTLKTHPSPRIDTALFIAQVDAKAPHFSDVISYLVSQMPDLMDKGLSGYCYVATSMPNPVNVPGLPKVLSGVFGVTIVTDPAPGAVDAMFKPLNDTIKAKWPGEASLFVISQSFPSFLAWYDIFYDQGQAGGDTYIVSRLLDRATVTGNSTERTMALMAPLPLLQQYSMYLVGGKGVINAKPPGGGNAVNPAWRNTYIHSTSSLDFKPFNQTAKKDAISALQEAYQPFRDLTPKSGAYLNEALPFEKDFQHTFWGSNYERLLKIKRQVDPHDVFWCFPCVGNERWQETGDGRLCRV